MSKVAFCLSLLLSLPCAAQHILAVTHTSALSHGSEDKVSGPAVDIARLTLQQAQLTDFQLTLYPLARALDMANKLPNVLIFPIARTAERESQYKWVGEIHKTQFQFYKLKARDEIHAKSLQELHHYRIGVVRNSNRHQLLQQAGLSKLILSAKALDTLHKLLHREIDIAPFNWQQAQHLCQQAQADCTQLERITALPEITTSQYLAFSVQTADDVVTRSKTAFARLKSDGTIDKILRTAP